MNRTAIVIVLAAVLVLAALPTPGQQSASFKLKESAVNAGGRPLNGTVAASASFRIALDSIAENAPARGLTSSSFRMDSGLISAYPPPGETLGLRFTDRTTLRWTPEKSVGTYNLYRDLLAALPGNYGTSFKAAIAGTTWVDSTTPPTGAGWFYLVTAENRLAEEGTKGYRSDNVERSNPLPCP